MANYFGYFLLVAGGITFLIAGFDQSHKSLPLIFAATMMVLAGLVIRQFPGTEIPALR
jgi:hypothetical protein